jgi:hypothetical protein
MPSERTRDQATLVLTALLAIALAAGAVLLVLLMRGSSGGRFEAAAPAAIDCPSGTGTPVCYGVVVTNVGDTAAQMRCEVSPGPDTAAVFSNGTDAYIGDVPIEAGRRVRLTVEVSPSEGSNVVSRPTVSCEAV